VHPGAAGFGGVNVVSLRYRRRMIKALRVLGWLEGGSLLLLMGVGMPLKYALGMPEMVKIVGSAHGGLFLLYVVLANATASYHEWPMSKRILAMVASIFPFGTFAFEWKYLRD